MFPNKGNARLLLKKKYRYLSIFYCEELVTNVLPAVE
jgi:hypothetical protein